ncbi:MAG: hypothetical protein ABIX10_11205 [Acidimicrobiales bacterium]
MLLLCTANQCRSPMAEVLLRHLLAEAGIEATVSSAGLYPGGAPATGHGIAVMADRGHDLEAHRSRRMEADMLERADLVIGMAREHVREAAVLEAGALAKTFTLKELVREAEAVGPRSAEEPLSTWLSRIAGTRPRQSLLGIGHDDELDVADPVGRGRADYEVTADLLDDLLSRVVRLAFPSVPAADRREERSA